MSPTGSTPSGPSGETVKATKALNAAAGKYVGTLGESLSLLRDELKVKEALLSKDNERRRVSEQVVQFSRLGAETQKRILKQKAEEQRVEKEIVKAKKEGRLIEQDGLKIIQSKGSALSGVWGRMKTGAKGFGSHIMGALKGMGSMVFAGLSIGKAIIGTVNTVRMLRAESRRTKELYRGMGVSAGEMLISTAALSKEYLMTAQEAQSVSTSLRDASAFTDQLLKRQKIMYARQYLHNMALADQVTFTKEFEFALGVAHGQADKLLTQVLHVGTAMEGLHPTELAREFKDYMMNFKEAALTKESIGTQLKDYARFINTADYGMKRFGGSTVMARKELAKSHASLNQMPIVLRYLIGKTVPAYTSMGKGFFNVIGAMQLKNKGFHSNLAATMSFASKMFGVGKGEKGLAALTGKLSVMGPMMGLNLGAEGSAAMAKMLVDMKKQGLDPRKFEDSMKYLGKEAGKGGPQEKAANLLKIALMDEAGRERMLVQSSSDIFQTSKSISEKLSRLIEQGQIQTAVALYGKDTAKELLTLQKQLKEVGYEGQKAYSRPTKDGSIISFLDKKGGLHELRTKLGMETTTRVPGLDIAPITGKERTRLHHDPTGAPRQFTRHYSTEQDRRDALRRAGVQDWSAIQFKDKNAYSKGGVSSMLPVGASAFADSSKDMFTDTPPLPPKAYKKFAETLAHVLRTEGRVDRKAAEATADRVADLEALTIDITLKDEDKNTSNPDQVGQKRRNAEAKVRARFANFWKGFSKTLKAADK